MGNIRNPIKKSSIAKKEKIIKSGFELMCMKGYYNVNTAQIAKHAGVSTGIIYQYFNDKRDIFIEGVKYYADSIMFPMINIIDNVIIEKKDLRNVLSKMIDSFISTHTLEKKAHEELMAMSYLDESVADIFKTNEMIMTEKVSSILVKSGFNKNRIEEKVHIFIGMIDNYCHEVVYHKHSNLDYKEMKESILNMISSSLSE